MGGIQPTTQSIGFAAVNQNWKLVNNMIDEISKNARRAVDIETAG